MRANQPELFVELGTKHILPAIAARNGQVGGAKPAPSREIRNQLRIFVVRMGRNVQDAPELTKVSQLLENCNCRGLLGSYDQRRMLGQNSNQHKRERARSAQAFHKRPLILCGWCFADASFRTTSLL